MSLNSETTAFELACADRLSGWSVVEVIGWLIDPNTRGQTFAEFVLSLGTTLRQKGAPTVRVRLSARTVEEPIVGWSSIWHFGIKFEPKRAGLPGFVETDAYRGSPIETVDITGEAYRARLERGIQPDAHRVLHELAESGLTDYLVVPVPMPCQTKASLSLATDRLGGFNDNDMKKFGVLAALMGTCSSAIESAKYEQHEDQIGGEE